MKKLKYTLIALLVLLTDFQGRVKIRVLHSTLKIC